jgi:hypothetical protein
MTLWPLSMENQVCKLIVSLKALFLQQQRLNLDEMGLLVADDTLGIA